MPQPRKRAKRANGPRPKVRPDDGRQPGKGGPRRKIEPGAVVRPKGSKIVTQALLPAAKGEANENDRRDAMFLFVMDLERRPVSWLHKEHFPHLFESTVQKWHIRDAWEEKRRHFWARVDDALFIDFSKRVTRARMAELEKLEKFAGRLSSAMDGEEMVKVTIDGNAVELPVIPKTYTTRDNAVRLMIALDERVDAKRGALMSDLPQVGASSVIGPASSGMHLSVEEAREMAHARLRVQARQLTSGGDASAEVEDPVQGGAGTEGGGSK